MSFKVQSYIILFFKEIDNKLQNIFRHSMKKCIATNQIKTIICLRSKKRAEMKKNEDPLPCKQMTNLKAWLSHAHVQEKQLDIKQK